MLKGLMLLLGLQGPTLEEDLSKLVDVVITYGERQDDFCDGNRLDGIGYQLEFSYQGSDMVINFCGERKEDLRMEGGVLNISYPGLLLTDIGLDGYFDYLHGEYYDSERVGFYPNASFGNSSFGDKRVLWEMRHDEKNSRKAHKDYIRFVRELVDSF